MSKLDLIIDALETGLKLTDGFISEWNQINKALATARELKALKPVAWVDWSMDGSQYSDTETSYGAPLYSLDGEQA